MPPTLPRADRAAVSGRDPAGGVAPPVSDEDAARTRLDVAVDNVLRLLRDQLGAPRFQTAIVDVVPVQILAGIRDYVDRACCGLRPSHPRPLEANTDAVAVYYRASPVTHPGCDMTDVTVNDSDCSESGGGVVPVVWFTMEMMPRAFPVESVPARSPSVQLKHAMDIATSTFARLPGVRMIHPSRYIEHEARGTREVADCVAVYVQHKGVSWCGDVLPRQIAAGTTAVPVDVRQFTLQPTYGADSLRASRQVAPGVGIVCVGEHQAAQDGFVQSIGPIVTSADRSRVGFLTAAHGVVLAALHSPECAVRSDSDIHFRTELARRADAVHRSRVKVYFLADVYHASAVSRHAHIGSCSVATDVLYCRGPCVGPCRNSPPQHHRQRLDVAVVWLRGSVARRLVPTPLPLTLTDTHSTAMSNRTLWHRVLGLPSGCSVTLPVFDASVQQPASHDGTHAARSSPRDTPVVIAGCWSGINRGRLLTQPAVMVVSEPPRASSAWRVWRWGDKAQAAVMPLGIATSCSPYFPFCARGDSGGVVSVVRGAHSVCDHDDVSDVVRLQPLGIVAFASTDNMCCFFTSLHVALDALSGTGQRLHLFQ